MKTADLKEMIDLVVEATIDEQPRLRDIFLQPAKDIVQTAGYAAERISGAAQKIIKGLAYILPTIIIPGLEFNYSQFAKDEQMKLDQIKKKYGDVLHRNWEAIKDPDVFGFLFLAYPQAMLGFAILKKSPLAFLQILETVTGGMDSVSQLRQSLANSAAYAPRQRQNSDPAGGAWGGGAGMNSMPGGSWGADYGNAGAAFESVLREAPEGVIQQIQALMQQPAVKQAIAASPMFKDMQAASVQIMVAPVARFMKLQTLDQMKGIIKPEAIEKAKQTIQANPEYQKADTAGKQAVLDALIPQIKTLYKQETIKWLQGLSSKTPGAAPAITQAISQITALK